MDYAEGQRSMLTRVLKLKGMLKLKLEGEVTVVIYAEAIEELLIAARARIHSPIE